MGRANEFGRTAGSVDETHHPQMVMGFAKRLNPSYGMIDTTRIGWIL
jgi:hypothetical protein